MCPVVLSSLSTRTTILSVSILKNRLAALRVSEIPNPSPPKVMYFCSINGLGISARE